MFRMITSVAPAALAAGAAAAMFGLAPAASAEPAQCADAAQTTVCQQPGNDSISVTPPQVGTGGTGSGANQQNGSYGPSGDTPPVGN